MGEESEDDYSDTYRTDKRLTITPMSTDDVLAQILNEVREVKMCMNSRLTSLELKTSILVQACNHMSSKIDNLEKRGIQTDEYLRNNDSTKLGSPNTPVLLPNDVNSHPEEISNNEQLRVITLSSENDYPNGSWLGDPNCPSKRVRCPITPQNLHHVNSICTAAEKMALVLLDYLFTREEIATSSLSGRSRWNKKQLDPLMIYGVRCHLNHKFHMSNKEWHRIRVNMDSKCRSAWRKRVKGIDSQPKTVSKISHTSVRKDPGGLTEEITFDFDQLQDSNLDLNCVKVITESPCELRILDATEEPMDQLPDNQEIILAGSAGEKRILMSNSQSVSMNTVVMSNEDLGQSLSISSDSHHHHHPLVMEEESHHHHHSSHHHATLSMEEDTHHSHHHHHHHHSSALTIEEDHHSHSPHLQHITLKDDVSLKDDRPSSIHQIDLKEAQSDAIHHITIKDEIEIKDSTLTISDTPALEESFTLQVNQHSILERDSENDD